ncbi:hypothetical protein L195_g056733 [Trifolium pratense]|uniref:Uncharacterized protein n=1 Tax=Trifolium pratense TaxID=57577 RepID=A0A2K3KT59_TRIPR|nr:hypothetical protein L195_g056733 [Trifolium pratense]
MGDWVSWDDKSQKLKSTIQFQKLLPTEDSPLADKIIETFNQFGVVPLSIEFLAMDDR